MVYLLTQASVIVTTTRIFAANSMRGHLALSPALPKLGQARPRPRLEIRLGATARLGAGARRRVRVRWDSCSMFHCL